MKHFVLAFLFGPLFAHGQTAGEMTAMLNNYNFIVDTTNNRMPLTITNVTSGWVAPQTGTLLHMISSNGGNARLSFDCYNLSNVQGSILQGRRSRGTYASPLPPDSGDVLIAIGGDGMGSTGFHSVSTGVATIRAEQTFTQTSAPTYFSVGLSPSGSIAQTEKFRIRSTGQLLLPFYASTGILHTDASGYVTTAALNSSEVTAALGYTPLSSYTETDPTFNTKFAAKTTDGLAEGSTNVYYTNTRARAALSAGTNISYNNSTGVITNTYTYTPPTPTLDTINAGARLFNTTYQVNASKYVDITLSGSVSCNLSLSGGQAGTISLQVSANGTTGWKTWGIIQGSNTGTLTIGLNTTQMSGSAVSASLAPGEYWRLATTSATGTPTFTFYGGGTKTYN